ncbi:MAG: undecaprenyldiphospho-muramoylpentapeptide beta-N-acetylglucosaminyltransferase [Eubacteriales bacterium]|nr:undecaprenyldiphospho-muramoylpentapeptide beta-N-acetylglucosaminyltransferase [Eubacteriales bacterium]
MRVLFTCGGTAGHINPAVGVAGRIRELIPDAEILFIGAEGRMETELVPREGFEIRTLQVMNLSREKSLNGLSHNLKAASQLVAALREAKQIIREFAPDVAVGTGGYVCYPVLKQAASLGIPTALHESNAVPGLTTKMLEKDVDRIMVGFEDSREHYSHPERVVVTGTPVRAGFRNHDRAEARRKLGIPDDRPLVLSVWGSLGADHMNEIMTDFIQLVCRKPAFKLIHVSGKRGYEKMLERLNAEGAGDFAEKGVDVREYVYDMPDVMTAADLVMCRSGASTLSELAALGKPAILVPSPNVTNNHQEKNARVLERAGAAKVLLEGEFRAESLLGTVSELLGRPETLAAMEQASAALVTGDPTERIADMVLELANKN